MLCTVTLLWFIWSSTQVSMETMASIVVNLYESMTVPSSFINTDQGQNQMCVNNR